MPEYIIIPLVAAFVGWITNVIAIKMTFYPLELKGYDLPEKLEAWMRGKGLPPKAGWQGIIPAKAAKIAGKSVDLLTSSLISVEEQFAQINPSIVAQEMRPTLERLSREIIETAMKEEIPLIWKVMPEARKQTIYASAAKEFPAVTEGIMWKVKSNIVDFFDVKSLAVDTLTENKALLNDLFLKCGKNEFRFIERSGFLFGGLFGLLQMAIYLYYPAWWLLPLGGLIVGFATNWLALKMIFEPVQPINLGIYKVQGLFIKRQREVAEEYANIVSNNILTVPRIYERIMDNPNTEQLLEIIRTHIVEGVDKMAGFNRSLIKLSAGTDAYDKIKKFAANRFMEELPTTMQDIFTYLEEALDIQYTLRDKMRELEPEEFVGVLRPAFQEDEWILILVGTALGFGAGMLQLLFLG